MTLDEQLAIPALRFGVSYVSEPVHVHYDVLAPSEPSRRPPVVMVHGGGHSGSGYLVTADFRPGWAHLFAARGWPAVVPDWPGSGRSGYIPSDTIDGETVCRGLGAVLEALGRPVVLMTHSMSGAFGWRLMETHGHLLAALVGVAPAPPGNIQPVPAIARETGDEIDLELGGRVTRLKKIGPNQLGPAFVTEKLVGKSRFFPREYLASYSAGLRAIEGRLLLQRQNVRGSQVHVGDIGKLAGQRVLVLTGTDDLDHPRAVDESIVAWLNSCGAKAEYLYLGDRGIVGNGHMLMIERNSDEIANVILDWLERAIPG